MRLIMMGTGPFAVPTFEALMASPSHEVLALWTRPTPTPPPGRRVTVAPPPMRVVGERWRLPIHDPVSINAAESLELLQGYRADLLVVCDYGQILSKTALQQARFGGVNLHASLLPKYRGAAPINWALYHGERVTGISVIHMTPRLDAGPCLIQEATEIGTDEDAVVLERRLSLLGSQAVLRAIDQLAGWDGASPLGTVQMNEEATQAPRLKKEDGWIDWQRSAAQIVDQIRAFVPWPGTFTEWLRPQGPLRLLVLAAHAESDDTSGDGEPGTVVRIDGEHAWIASGRGTLRVDQLQPAGKSRQAMGQFLRGYPLAVGDRWGRAEV